jgi:hypothetical protein
MINKRGGIHQSGDLKCDYLAFHLIPYLRFNTETVNTNVRKHMHILTSKASSVFNNYGGPDSFPES